ncbi:hypothetical protein [Polaromonas sp. YR568]
MNEDFRPYGQALEVISNGYRQLGIYPHFTDSGLTHRELVTFSR